MTQFSTTYCQIIDGNRTCLSKPFRVDFSLSTKVEDFIDNVWNKIPPLPAQRTIESILAWKLKQPPLFAPRSTRKKTEHDLQAFISSLHFPEEGTPEALIGNNDVRMLYDPYPLETYWNRIPPQDTIPIVLTIKYSLEPGHTAVEEFQQLRKEDFQRAREACSPSTAAAMPAFIEEQKKRPILIGRPDSGPPIHIFHPCFQVFSEASKSNHQPDSATCKQAKDLIIKMSRLYAYENDRNEAIAKAICDLLGVPLAVIQATQVKGGGCTAETIGRSLAFILVHEIKNEVGTGGSDPLVQGGYALRKYLVDQAGSILTTTYAPSFILAIAGPHLWIAGAIYHERLVVEPLVDLSLTNPRRRNFFALCRLINALKVSLLHLKDYYRMLPLTPSFDIDAPDVAGFPYIHQYMTTKFAYICRLGVREDQKLVFKARETVSGKLIVVKFVEDYNPAAHRLLEAKGLAPPLLYAGCESDDSVKFGDYWMVIMEFFVGSSPSSPLTSGLYKRVEAGIQALHEHNFVFGDLRLPNLLVKDREVKFIDFDWCAKEGEGRYPVDLNRGLDWPHGVEPNGAMLKTHNIAMMKKLKAS